MAELSLEKQVHGLIKKKGSGNFTFASDFTSIGEQKTINKALEHLAKEGVIIQISRGVYYYPKIHKVLDLVVLYPTLEDIAEGIAKRDKTRIVPTGVYALTNLGFSTQIPMNIVFLTDRSERKFNTTQEILAHTKELLAKNDENVIEQDYNLMPAWVSSIIRSLYTEQQ